MRSSSAARTRPVDDAELIRLVRLGHSDAYGELVRRYQDRVFNACWRVCGNVEDARDVTQDAFLKAYENLDSFRQESGFYTWLFRVAMNLSLSLRRSARNRRSRTYDAATDLGTTQAGGLAERLRRANREGDEPCSDTAVQSSVVKALLALDDEDRAVVVLRDIEGFDYRRIAEVLGMPLGTVRSKLHRSRAALRDAILPLLAQDGGANEPRTRVE